MRVNVAALTNYKNRTCTVHIYCTSYLPVITLLVKLIHLRRRIECLPRLRAESLLSQATDSLAGIEKGETHLKKGIESMPPKKKSGKGTSGAEGEDSLTRIAIISAERCKPKKCRQECKKSCPVVKLGKLCIEVGPKSKLAFISEPLCIG
jgi:hypothetical protein